jgi:hypothetical protein
VGAVKGSEIGTERQFLDSTNDDKGHGHKIDSLLQ